MNNRPSTVLMGWAALTNTIKGVAVARIPYLVQWTKNPPFSHDAWRADDFQLDLLHTSCLGKNRNWEPFTVEELMHLCFALPEVCHRLLKTPVCLIIIRQWID